MGFFSDLFSRKDGNKQNAGNRKASNRCSFKEPMLAGAERIIDVKEMTDEKVQQTIEFIASIYEGPMPKYTLQRNGDIVRIMLSSDVMFIDFCSWVNNFNFADSDGHVFQVKGRYPVTAASWGETQVSEANLDFFTPDNLNIDVDYLHAFFLTPDGRRYRVVLGDNVIEPLEE